MLADVRARGLVVGAQHRPSLSRWCGEHAALSRNNEGLRHERPDAARASSRAAGPAGPRNGDTLKRRVIADVIRRLAVSNLPYDLALVEIDRRDASPWRFHQRQPLHGGSRTATCFSA